MEEEEKNIILIVLDTMRKDYADKYIWPVLKKYGFKKHDRAIAPAPWTTPSHVSMLTGMYPLEHATHLDKRRPGEHLVVLSKIGRNSDLTRSLRTKNYKTVLFSANILVSPFFGYSFDKYRDVSAIKDVGFVISKRERECITKAITLSKNKLEGLAEILRTCGPKIASKLILRRLSMLIKALTTDWPKEKGIKEVIEACKTLDFSKNKTFFLINLMEMHEPYLLSIEFDPKRLWKTLYDRESRYLAKNFEELIRILFEKFDPKNTLYVVTSDHGQMLGENGLYGHIYWLHDELLFVPLYIKNCCDTLPEVTPPFHYISLTQIKDLILHGKMEPKEWALAESFATKKYGETVFVHRIAVYYKEYKGIFSVDDWKWECWKTYNGEEEVPEEIRKEMMKIVIRHLKKGLMMKKARELGKKLKKKKEG